MDRKDFCDQLNMKLPPITSKDQPGQILFLSLVSATILLITLFFMAPGLRRLVLKISAVPKNTATVRLDLISPHPNIAVSQTVPLVFSLTNGPKITSATIKVDNKTVQAVKTEGAETLTLNWDTTKHANGKHTVLITVTDNQNLISELSTSFEVKNGDKASNINQ